MLSYFSAERRTASPQELGRAIGLSPAAVEELAVDLVRGGCLERDDSGSYCLAGPGVLRITVKDER
jgi:DNA-binding IclR family transcriptional regulator